MHIHSKISFDKLFECMREHSSATKADIKNTDRSVPR